MEMKTIDIHNLQNVGGQFKIKLKDTRVFGPFHFLDVKIGSDFESNYELAFIGSNQRMRVSSSEIESGWQE